MKTYRYHLTDTHGGRNGQTVETRTITRSFSNEQDAADYARYCRETQGWTSVVWGPAEA